MCTAPFSIIQSAHEKIYKHDFYTCNFCLDRVAYLWVGGSDLAQAGSWFWAKTGNPIQVSLGHVVVSNAILWHQSLSCSIKGHLRALKVIFCHQRSSCGFKGHLGASKRIL